MEKQFSSLLLFFPLLFESTAAHSLYSSTKFQNITGNNSAAISLSSLPYNMQIRLNFYLKQFYNFTE